MRRNNSKEQQNNNSLDKELQAQYNDDFEQQYLAICLKDLRSDNFYSNRIGSTVHLQKTPEMIASPKPESEFLQGDAITLSELQSQNLKNQRDTGSSLMTFFFIRRFLDKIGSNKKKIENLNKSILNLISDKASESSNILNFAKSIKRKELTFISVQKIFAKQIIKQKTLERIKEQISKIKKQVLQFFLFFIHLIPLIQPESAFKIYWNFFTTFVRGIIVFLVPLEISFNPKILISNNDIFPTILFIILQLDYIFRINTITYRSGKAIIDRLEIIKIQSTNVIIIDQVITYLFLIQKHLPQGNFDLLLLLLMTQIRYVYHSFLKIDQVSYLTRPQRGILGLMKFLTTLVYVAHIFSCIWFWFSSIDQQVSWIITKGLHHLTWSSQYLEAFYFAIVTMLTIGYGDNVPQNQIEKIVTIIFILGACMWFSYSVNFIGGIIDDITQNQVERNKKMRVINKYMIEREIPYALQYKVKEYLTFRWKEDDEVDLEMEQALLGQLSDELKETLDKQAYKIFIIKCDFLQKYFSSEFREALFKSIKRKIIPPQNTFSIEMNGDINLCYLEQGKLLYQHKDCKQRSKINSQIEQGQFICVRQFLQKNQDKEYFKAAGYVSLLTLSKTDFLETLKDYPEDFQKYCQLKDEVSLQVYSKKFNNEYFCPVCNNSDHLLSECQQVQLILDKELIIKKHCYNFYQTRRKFKRRFIEKPIQTRAEMLFVQECARIFNLDNPQLIANQLQFQNVIEQESDNNNNILNEYHFPSVKVFPATEDFLITSVQQKAIKCIDLEVQSEFKICQNQKQSKKTNKSIFRLGSIYDHKFLRQNTKSPSLLSNFNELSIETSQNETYSGNAEIEAIRKQITDFNNVHSENIKMVFQNISKNHEHLMQSKQFQDILHLHILQNTQNIENFDQIFSFDFYYPQFNICKILEQVNKNKQYWQSSILQKFSKYLFYPFNFILKFLKYKRTKSYMAASNKFESIQRAKHKIMLIRGNKSSFKRNQILPENQQKEPNLQKDQNQCRIDIKIEQ